MMALPVLLALDEDQEALGVLETQLSQRYAHDYRVESLGDPDLAQGGLLRWRTAARKWRWSSPG